ncbi:MAG: transketolase C-terminal domain-containing protein [Chloroflexota bacterium]
MELINRVHANNIVAWAADKPEVVVLTADLTGSTEVDLFRDEFPGRTFSLGMAEQNLISWAGGLAREGFTPFVHTFSVFMYRRPYDQLHMSVAYPNLRVRLFGFLPGITTPGGVTHQAIDDISTLRGVPNMTLLEVGDATDVESVLDVAQAVNGPVYVRMLRGELPRLFDANDRMTLNQARVLTQGDDLLLLSSGICTEEAMRATQVLQAKGVSIQHMHITTHKPFDDPTVLEALSQTKKAIITMENHTVMGGLGTNVAEMMATNGIGGKPLVRMGLQDTYAHGASKQYLMKEYKLDAIALVRQVEAMLGESFNISEADLAEVRLEATTSLSKAQLEAL